MKKRLIMATLIMLLPIGIGKAFTAPMSDVQSMIENDPLSGVPTKCGGNFTYDAQCTFSCSAGDSIYVYGFKRNGTPHLSWVRVVANCGGLNVVCYASDTQFGYAECESMSEDTVTDDDTEGSCVATGGPRPYRGRGSYLCSSINPEE